MTWPIAFTWTGEVMEPLRRFHNICNAVLVVGQVYTLEEVLERSSKSHRHYFASVNEAWRNLPEEIGDRFPTSEHLRKHALIYTGWRDERTFVASSKVEALRLAVFLRPADEFAIVVVRDNVVIEWKAKSQSGKAMKREEFQKSKDDVLGFLADMIEVKPRELERAAA